MLFTMSSIATLSSKSQISIPAWARRQLGLRPGAKLQVRVEADRIIIEPVRRDLESLEGSLQGVYGDPAGYIDELREDRRS